MDASSQPSWSKTMPVDALVRTVVANSLVDQVTEEIRSSIVTGLLPAGQQFSVTMLADQLGVSHIPVREALRRLETEGLITMRPARQAVVRPMDRHDVEGIYRLRKLIEPALAQLSCELLSTEELDRLDELLTIYGHPEASVEEEITAHEEFHLRLVKPAASEWDLRVLAYVWNANRRYARLLFDPADRQVRERLDRLHHALLAAARSGSPERLEKALYQHLEHNEKALVKAVGERDAAVLDGQLATASKRSDSTSSRGSRAGAEGRRSTRTRRSKA
jgi:DNA-binding GntR family transcriptional regulator